MNDFKHISEDVAALRKHISVLNDHSGELAKEQKEISKHVSIIEVSVAELKTDMSWLKKSYWLIAGASVGALLSSVIGLLVSK